MHSDSGLGVVGGEYPPVFLLRQSLVVGAMVVVAVSLSSSILLRQSLVVGVVAGGVSLSSSVRQSLVVVGALPVVAMLSVVVGWLLVVAGGVGARVWSSLVLLREGLLASRKHQYRQFPGLGCSSHSGSSRSCRSRLLMFSPRVCMSVWFSHTVMFSSKMVLLVTSRHGQRTAPHWRLRVAG